MEGNGRALATRRRRRTHRPTSPEAWLVLVLAVLGLSPAGCTPDCTPPAGSLRPNVVLVTIDTLRADHLGGYGNPVVRTPELDRLGNEGILFERCYAQTNVTVPSHLTIFSSLPLADHGVFSNDDVLNRSLELVPQLFARAGYRTAAVVSAKHVGPEFALGTALTALDLYDAPRRLSVPIRAGETNRRLIPWLRGVCGGPFFVWVHYWDPHMPYAPPRPFDRTYYHGDPYDPAHESMSGVTLAWHLYEPPRLRSVLAERESEVRALQDELGVSWRELRDLILYRQNLAAYADGPGGEATLRRRLGALAEFVREHVKLRRGLAAWLTDVRDLRFPHAQYAGEVSYVDKEIGRLRGEIERLGIAGRTIVLVTADHGESLGEHGIYFDHAGLYEQSVRVPLIVWAPGRLEPARRSELVRSLDIAPTLLRLAGLPVPDAMQGRSLFDGDLPGAPVVAESYRGHQIMLVEGRWKLIRTLVDFHYAESFSGQAGRSELYDLIDDPNEIRNLASAQPELVRALGSRLDTWRADRHPPGNGGGPSPRPSSRSRQQREGLRALGYVE